MAAYAAISKFLRINGIFTPKLLGHNYPKGIIVIEDFGNTSFHKVLLKKKNKFEIYKRLVDLLIKIQKIKSQFRIRGITKKNQVRSNE